MSSTITKAPPAGDRGALDHVDCSAARDGSNVAPTPPADKIVAEMAELGAIFQTSADGDRWFWEPRPEIMRNAIRKFWRAAQDRPSDRQMIEAIRRLHHGGAA